MEERTLEQSMSSKEIEIHLRKQKVYDLILQGLTQEQIAAKLETSTKTISRDVKEIKKDSIIWMDTLPRGQIQMYHRSNFETIERVIKELWELYETSEDTKLKIKILKAISDNRKISATLIERADIMNLSDNLHEKLNPDPFASIFDNKKPKIDYDKIVN